MLTTEEIANRVTYHAPSKEGVERHAALSQNFSELMHTIEIVMPEGREKSIVFTKLDNVYLELFQASGEDPGGKPEGDGPAYPGIRHLAFQVDDVDAQIRAMGEEAVISLGPLDFDAFIPGWRTVWLVDPDGRIVEVTQGYVDERDPPPLEEGISLER